MPTEKPPTPVPESYRPPAGIRHPVTKGESWISLAKTRGMDAWDLIEFNFPGLKTIRAADPQRAMRYVNWYLSEYVGCRVTDGVNYSFSTGITQGKGSWKGGVVYLPPGAAPPPPPPPPKKRRFEDIDGEYEKLPFEPPACAMSRPDGYRLLTPKERQLALRVFGNTLPAWDQIGIGNGLGLGGRPWTDDGDVDDPNTPNVGYAINVGDLAFLDLTLKGPTKGWLCANFGRICDVFVHEMTHVWQMFNVTNHLVIRSAWGQSWFGAGYEYKVGDPWDDYNMEQQAHLVEDWHKYETDYPSLAEDRYPYVRLVVQSGRNSYPRGLDLEQLKKDLESLKNRGYK